MKKINLIAFFILILFQVHAQQRDTWIAFRNKKSNLIGFKDKTGKVKIPPKFSDYTIASRFDDIIGVAEEKNGKIDNYYLTKKGRIVGRDSLYIYDYAADCESEGFILFRDPATHKVGMFNRKGDIAIPAIYDDLMPVRNGMIMALKGGHWDASLQSEHIQFPWVGSKSILIDTRNKVLIENFPVNEDIDFFSLLISDSPNKNPTRQNFKGVNEKYYSFINFDKEFRVWLKGLLTNGFSKADLIRISYRNIYFWSSRKHWIHEIKTSFADKNFKLIKSKLLELNEPHSDYDVSTDDLNPYIYNSKEFEKYYDNCGNSKKWIYPIKTIVINHHTNHDLLQDDLSFLRTDGGYKLIEVSIRVH